MQVYGYCILYMDNTDFFFMSVVVLWYLHVLSPMQIHVPAPVLKSEPTEDLLPLRIFPNSEELYAEDVKKCLDATNLTMPNVEKYMNAVHQFIPYNFDNTLPNHCWKAPVKLNIGTTVVSGHVNGTEFRVNRTNIPEWKLNIQYHVLLINEDNNNIFYQFLVYLSCSYLDFINVGLPLSFHY